MSLKFQVIGPPLLLGLFAGAARQRLLCRRFFRRRFLHRLLALGGLLRDLLACDFHSTLHALTSRKALARLRAAGEVACCGSTVSGMGTAGQRPRVVS